MSGNKFKVIYTGKLKDGFEVNQVAAQFAIKFKLTPEKALKILQANKKITLNKGVEHVKAYGLKSTFENMGMIIKLEQAALFTPTLETEQPKTSSDEEKPTSSDNSVKTPNWDLDPVEKPIDTEDNSLKQQYSQEPNDSQATTNNSKISIEVDDNPGFLKKFGGVILAIGAGLLFFLKKFGLFKLLKIGALVAVGASIGFNSEEVCMDNSRCEDAVDDQIDSCWEDNGFDDIDWDNITEEEYYTLKPKIENDFIACFVYEDTGQRIFKSPIDLRFDIMELCEGNSELSNCNKIVEPQIHGCYEQSNLSKYFNQSTTDFYAVYSEHPEAISSYYSCFVDENGGELFYFDND